MESFCLSYWRKRAEREVTCTGVPVEEATRPAAVTCARLKEVAHEGGMELHHGHAAACLAALEIAGCGPTGLGDVRLCRDSLRGLLPAGAPCRAHHGFGFVVSECDEGAGCISNYTQFDCSGRCVVRSGRAEGEACHDHPCADDLLCRAGNCVRVPPAGVGESCGGPVAMPNPPCAEGLDCLSGNVCRRRDSLPTCTSSFDCEDFKRCVGGTCVPNVDGPCSENGCAGDGTCIAGRCAPRRAVGQPCSELQDWLPCQPGSYCSGGACRARGLEGQPCSAWELCGPGTCARSLDCVNGVCTRILAVGDACPSTFERTRCCVGDTACVRDVCVAVDRCY